MDMMARVRENFADWPSAKIGPHENFPLYGTLYTSLKLQRQTGYRKKSQKVAKYVVIQYMKSGVYLILSHTAHPILATPVNQTLQYH